MRKASHWTLAALGALCLSGSAALPIAAAAPAPLEFSNAAAGACLQSPDGSAITLTDCNPGDTKQNWSREYLGDSELIRVNRTNSCMGHAGGSNVRLMPCDSNDATQQWRVEAADEGNLLHHMDTDSCLGHLGGSEVQLFPCEPENPAQQWGLTAS
ncbi:RICIN domain-containing protein [Saccharopolyspora shandongensis]|uniref:Ricin-type beta-trefoil lectin domain-containing protein n=1 Tax=Saccharopolyspora shandongensis TaxID=418495 RepID=A0A1H2ZH14_9PSEU|nr:RICIN domain-containing protein [Saccharopolyspora shandongensis]SDX16671.1 Ricin-type beta-trefoil lectin domain-containing protein [Saccharopolyspora shandongensis]